MRIWRGIPASIILHACAASFVLAGIAEHEEKVKDVASVPVELLLEIDSSPILEQHSAEEVVSVPEPVEEPPKPEPEPGPTPEPVATPAPEPQPAPEPVAAPAPEPVTEVTAPAAPVPVAVPKPVERLESPAPKPPAPAPARERRPSQVVKKAERPVTSAKKVVKQKAALAAGKGSQGKIRSTDGRAAEQNYKSKILARLRSAKRYPEGARRRGLEGTAVLSFTIDASGRLTAARITGRSGEPVIDEAALAMARNAAPFPPFPQGMNRQHMSFRVPVQFDID